MTGRNAGLLAREVDHRAIDELDRGRAELDDVLRVLHRAMQRREVHDAERAVRGQRRKLEREAARPRERAFAADQEVRVVDAAVGGVRPLALRVEDVDVVAADAPQDVRHLARDLVALALADRAQRRTRSRARALGAFVAFHRRLRSGPKRASVPSASIASIAATLCTMLPYAIEREPQELLPAMPPRVACADVLTSTGNHTPCGFSQRVERVEHDAGLHGDVCALRVVAEHAVQVLAVVDDERGADRLPALRAAGAARQHRARPARGRPRRPRARRRRCAAPARRPA